MCTFFVFLWVFYRGIHHQDRVSEYFLLIHVQTYCRGIFVTCNLVRSFALCLVSPVAWQEDSTNELHVVGTCVSRAVGMYHSIYIQSVCLRCTVSVFTTICCIHKYNISNKIFIRRHMNKHPTTLCNKMTLHHPLIQRNVM